MRSTSDGVARPVRTVANCDLRVRDRLVHLVHRFEERLVDHGHSVPRPVATVGHARWRPRRRAPDEHVEWRSELVDEGAFGAALRRCVRSDPGFDMSNTTIGMPLSRQNAIAVASITLRSLVMTSR